MPEDICPNCGRPIDAHNRHVRFRLPDPVLQTPAQERTEGTWMTDPDPNKAVMIQVPGVGPFVRCLLPVKLTGGYTITFGVWMVVHPDDLQRIARVWWEPEYSDLTFDCWLANHIPVFGLLAAPAKAAVRDKDETPYLDQSSDPRMSELLTKAWPHEQILSAISA